MQTEIDAIENLWSTDCVKAGKAYAPLGENGKRINVWQVINGIVTRWIEDGIMPAGRVQSGDVRDATKVKDVIKIEWDHHAADFKAEVKGYLRLKRVEAARKLGMEVDPYPSDCDIESDPDYPTPAPDEAS